VGLGFGVTGGPDVIQKAAWPFYRTISGVRLCWELEEPVGLGIWGLGFGVCGLGSEVWGLGFGVWGLGFGVGGF
jgi:hypothetical protein